MLEEYLKKTEPEYYPPVENLLDLIYEHYTENNPVEKNTVAGKAAKAKEKKLEETKSRMSLDDLFNQIQEGNLKELNIVVKADVQGSVEAVKQSLVKLSNEEVVVKIVHGGVGAINESDVMLAAASNAIIIGFNVIKAGINGAVTFLLYKRIAMFLRK